MAKFNSINIAVNVDTNIVLMSLESLQEYKRKFMLLCERTRDSYLEVFSDYIKSNASVAEATERANEFLYEAVSGNSRILYGSEWAKYPVNARKTFMKEFLEK